MVHKPSSMVSHISTYSSLSSQLFTKMLITTLLRKGPCRSTYKNRHQIPEAWSFKLYFHQAGCIIFIPTSINLLLWVSCGATKNLTEVKKYLGLMLPTYPPSQRLFFRSPCWLFSVLLMSSKYLQIDFIVACLRTLADIECRITGLLFAKSLPNTGTMSHLLSTEWAFLLPPFFSGASVSLLNDTGKGKYLQYYILKLWTGSCFSKGKINEKKLWLTDPNFQGEGRKVWVYFGCGRKDSQKTRIFTTTTLFPPLILNF